MAEHSPTAVPEQGADPAAAVRGREVARVGGWALDGGGRAVNVAGGTWYRSTSHQVCGLFPFAVGAGAAPKGIPIGRHLHTHEPVGLDTSELLRQGLVSNTGIWCQAQPGAGKSALIKRLMVGYSDFGFFCAVPGDVKGEYTPVVKALGGSVWRIGWGLDNVNPLDPGPLRHAITASVGQERESLLDTVRNRQLRLLEALVTIVRRQQTRPELTTTEQMLLSRALDLAITRHTHEEPVIPDLLEVLSQAPDELRTVTASDSPAQFHRDARDLANSLRVLCEGAIRGLFDRPSTVDVQPDVAAMSLDLSALERSDDEIVAAAMLAAWVWAGNVIDAAQVQGTRRNVFRPMDELWRALRAAPGLVEYADQLTRLNRHRGEVTVQSTHSFDDLYALSRAADVAKARGMAGRNGLLLLGGLDLKQIEAVRSIANLTSGEAATLTRWAAPPTWVPGQLHPGRGKFLAKAGERVGIPVGLELTPLERRLYDTDRAWRQAVEP